MTDPFAPPDVSDSARSSRTFPAYLVLRAAAAMVDSMIVLFVSAVISIVPWILARPINEDNGFNFLRPIWLFTIPLILGVTSLVYHVVALTKFGATFGKELFHIQIESVTGSRIKFLQSCIRAVVSWLSILSCGFGYIVACFNENRRTLHDLASGTVAVHNRITKR